MELPHPRTLTDSPDGGPEGDDAPRASGRRALIAGAGLAAGAALVPQAAEAASAHHHGTKLLSTQARHLVGRFSYGVTPALANQVRQHGGARDWFEWQLSPHHVHDPDGTAVDRWFPQLDWAPRKVSDENNAGDQGYPAWRLMADYQAWLLLRRMRSHQQLLEVMTEFWENHFNVPVSADGVYTYRVRYGRAIRARALDSFEALLQAVSVHPAMGMYLGNAVSDKDHPNENQGRELLELHTVGLAAGYGEHDVVSSARILTGWRVDIYNTWAAFYDPGSHYRGHVKVLGFHRKNSSPNGRGLTQEYLHYLAHHPATAQHIATKLATVFVSDQPPKRLVNHLAHVFRAHGTQIKPVLRALVDSPEFKHSVGEVVRDPENDLVATYRLLGIHVDRPHPTTDNVYPLLYATGTMGQEPMAWPAPNGRPIVGAAWSSPSRVMGSMSEHFTLANGWYPTTGIRYRQPMSWMPAKAVRFDHLVDHLAQQILHRHADKHLQEACRKAVGVPAHQFITAQHPLIQWNFGRLLSTFLDSPDFFRR